MLKGPPGPCGCFEEFLPTMGVFSVFPNPTRMDVFSRVEVRKKLTMKENKLLSYLLSSINYTCVVSFVQLGYEYGDGLTRGGGLGQE